MFYISQIKSIFHIDVAQNIHSISQQKKDKKLMDRWCRTSQSKWCMLSSHVNEKMKSLLEQNKLGQSQNSFEEGHLLMQATLR